MRKKTKYDMVVNFISKVCLSLVGLISLFSLYFWFLDQVKIASFGVNSIPMAPSTAMFNILFTIDVALKSKINGNRVARFFEKIVLISICIISISIVLEKIFGFSHEIEYFLLNNKNIYLGTQLWKMSPVTGICIILIALSLQINMFLTNKEVADKIFTIIQLVIGAIAGTIIIGYGYKTPFLYGGTIIPVALPTGICFFLLTIATITSFGNNTRIIKAFNGTTVTSNLMRTIIPITLIGIIVMGIIEIICTNYEIFSQALLSAISLIVTIFILNGTIIFASKKIGLIIDIETKKRILSEQELKKLNYDLKETNAQLEEEITERIKVEEKIIYLSYHDKLTGLYNRRFYEEEIKRLDTERNLPISIIIGDVNRLKIVNDVFGHYKGDELLQKAAKAIQGACRPDDIVARWGGDE